MHAMLAGPSLQLHLNIIQYAHIRNLQGKDKIGDHWKDKICK